MLFRPGLPELGTTGRNQENVRVELILGKIFFKEDSRICLLDLLLHLFHQLEILVRAIFVVLLVPRHVRVTNLFFFILNLLTQSIRLFQKKTTNEVNIFVKDPLLHVNGGDLVAKHLLEAETVEVVQISGFHIS